MNRIDPGDALRDRVLSFFASNPEETLTASDISRKFTVGIRLVPEALIPAVASGHLRLNAHGDYSVGPKMASAPVLPFVPCEPPGAPALMTPPAPRTRRTTAALPPLPDPAQLRIESGMPLPEKPQPKGKVSPYTPLFEAMNKGDSISMTTDHARRLIGSAQHLGKKLGRKFVHRQIGGGQSRIWRIE